MANNHTAGAAARTFAPSELCQRMLAKTSKGHLRSLYPVS